jgi:Mrp family chromosome partitioning ATPase
MMTEDNTRMADKEGKDWNEQTGPKVDSQQLVRLLKPVVVRPERGKSIDPNEVSPRFYNCFHYSMLMKESTEVNLTVGITSANPSEGKTLVAANLAVSLAVANQRETALVDLNFQSPSLHRIFGTEQSPGLVEALSEATIQVSRTQLEHLYLLSAGNVSGGLLATEYVSNNGKSSSDGQAGPTAALEQVAAFRDVLYSLRQEFEFVIVDMPAIYRPPASLLLVDQMDGILVVVNANKTKHEDLQRMFRQVNQKQILGFIFNRVRNDFLT